MVRIIVLVTPEEDHARRSDSPRRGARGCAGKSHDSVLFPASSSAFLDRPTVLPTNNDNDYDLLFCLSRRRSKHTRARERDVDATIHVRRALVVVRLGVDTDQRDKANENPPGARVS